MSLLRQYYEEPTPAASNTLGERIHEAINELVPDAVLLEVPSPMFTELQGRYLKYTAERALLCAFPAQRKYADAAGHIQSGIIGTAFDTSFATLAMLTARRPCSAVSATINAVRGLEAGAGEFCVEVRLRARARGLIFLIGKAVDPRGKTVATANATMGVQKVDRM